MFSLPRKTHLRQGWIQFIKGESLSVTSSSKNCIDDTITSFEQSNSHLKKCVNQSYTNYSS